jgi:hypothetical protein
MGYSDCPQVDALTRRLVSAYREISESEIESGAVVNDLHLAIMEHKSSCLLCKRLIMKSPVVAVGTQRVA